MCIAAHQAQFTGTNIYFNANLKHPKKGLVAAMAYSNKAENRHGGPNAMLLTVPAEEFIEPEDFINVSACPHILDDMREALTPRTRGMLSASSDSYSKGIGRIAVFEYGIYTVVSADDPLDMPRALLEVPEEKRPTIPESIWEFLKQKRPNDKVILPCFTGNGNDTIFFIYKPILENGGYRLPGLDAHDGTAPRPGKVAVDTWILLGADNLAGASAVYYQDNLTADIAPYLAKKVVGRHFTGEYDNGDYVLTPGLLSYLGHIPPVFGGTVDIGRTWDI